MSKARCVTGCKVYCDDETYHHKDCPFYPGSFSERFDKLQAENEKYRQEVLQTVADSKKL